MGQTEHLVAKRIRDAKKQRTGQAVHLLAGYPAGPGGAPSVKPERVRSMRRPRPAARGVPQREVELRNILPGAKPAVKT